MTETRSRREVVGVSIDRASIPRVYDIAMGGKDNYDVDRAAWAQIQEIAPRQRYVLLANRGWLARVVRWMAERVVVDQFLDLGAGLPTRDPLHRVAQECGRTDRRFVYIDNDPVCNAHGRVLLEQREGSHYLPGDLADPDATLKAAGQYLDLDRPIGVLFGAVLHHFSDDEDPASITARYIELLAPGSYVAISHYTDPGARNQELHLLARDLERAHVEMGLGSGWYRSPDQIRGFFHDLEMVDPGLVQLDQWWPQGPPLGEKSPEEWLMIGGVGQKPDPTLAPVPIVR